MPSGGEHLLLMQGIVKAFSGTRALDGVDFDVGPGEVHALIGENGAGKSTLMNVLAGRFDDYEGSIVFDGRSVRITNPRQARRMGIGVIYQDLSVLPNFTVAENIMLGEEKTKSWPPRLDRAATRAGAQQVIDYLGFELDPDAPVASLSTAQQCLVEIAAAVRRNVKLLVFDEPTAALGDRDVDRLFRVIDDLRSRGLGMVYISHRLAELHGIADRVTVLRDGKVVGTRPLAECRMADLSRMMLGHELSEVFPEKSNHPGDVLLRVDNLSRPGAFEGISFELHAGEILGIAGLVGSGRSEIARAIVGADRSAGAIVLRGKTLARRSPGVCRSLGMGMLPESRKTQGNITGRPVRENLTVGVLERLSTALGFLNPRNVTASARRSIDRVGVDPPNPEMEIQRLSGGNQQKVIVGRWLAAEPGVLIFDEPTQGIDVGTKAQIYRLIVELAAQGRGIILISSELIEIARLADRILVVRDGRLAGEMPGGDVDVDALFAQCAMREQPA